MSPFCFETTATEESIWDLLLLLNAIAGMSDQS